MRFLFYIPDSPVVRGGISVFLEFIEVLNANDIEAVALYDRPDFEYNSHVIKAPRTWSACVRRPIADTGLKKVAQVLRGYALPGNRRLSGNAERCPEWTIRTDDVLVVPEFAADWMPNKLPQDLPLILLVQGPFTLLRMFSRPEFRVDRFAGAVSTSAACSAGCRMVLGSEPASVPLYISEDLYAYQPKKSFQVAYMPRKRTRDSVPLIKALKAAPGMENVPFVPIDGVSTSEAARLLRESLFFLSLPEREGFGLPAAEAMASGALVIGYSGVGGDEFFDETTGFPIPEDNLMKFYETAVSVISNYKADSKYYDERRLRASKIILGKYTRLRFEQSVVRVFSEFQSSLQSLL